MPLSQIKRNLERVGLTVEVKASTIVFVLKGEEKTVEVSAEWMKEIRSFNRTTQICFDLSARKMIGPRSIEVGISRLNQEFSSRPRYTFRSSSNRVVKISPASMKWGLSFMDSEEYVDFFEVVVAKMFAHDNNFSFDKLLWLPLTIEFSVPRKMDRIKLLAEGEPALDACLFKMAVERNECWDFSRKRKRRSISFYGEQEVSELNIPTAIYDSNMVKYYKVAVSSQFPSQSFLSFYHVLEYNFLSVSDEVLHGKLKAHINSTGFKSDENSLEKVVSIVKKHSDSSDETELLTRVLRKFVDDEELIDFIDEIEKSQKENMYSKRHEVFGESFQVQLKRDHVISNVSKLLKHVRNALVHSSDRYNHEDCHIPLTDSENIVENYIPLIRFLAEKVIYAKSS